ncbi:hypothetical protein BJ508DRAFT_313103 [Ascobolus immersus RN42]|uniref:Uncharacterized protein n=1 Tax=Ascobolus immersus RN42 TaxID=1160509 RepID=A0A3N4HX07_ASCIM|nr:hypothetical protein BJ508DRAFT_313103 [Ascobolus immersus RN42]
MRITFNDLPYEIRIEIFKQLATVYDATAFRCIDTANYFSIITDRLYNKHFLRVSDHVYRFFKAVFGPATSKFLIHMSGILHSVPAGQHWRQQLESRRLLRLQWIEGNTLAHRRTCLEMLAKAIVAEEPPRSRFDDWNWHSANTMLNWTARIIETGLHPPEQPISRFADRIFACTRSSTSKCRYPEIRKLFRLLQDRAFSRQGAFSGTGAYAGARYILAVALYHRSNGVLGRLRPSHDDVFVNIQSWNTSTLGRAIMECVSFMDELEDFHTYVTRRNSIAS